MSQLIQFILNHPTKPDQNVIYDRTINDADLHHQTPQQYGQSFLKWMFKTKPSSFNHIETWIKPHIVTEPAPASELKHDHYQHVTRIKDFFQLAKKINQAASYKGHTDTFVPILKLTIKSDQKKPQTIAFEHELYPDQLNGKTTEKAANTYVNWVKQKYPGVFDQLKHGLNYQIIYTPAEHDQTNPSEKIVNRLNQLNVYARKWIMRANYQKPETPKTDSILDDVNDGRDDLKF